MLLTRTHHALVANAMRRDKFETIFANFHLADNNCLDNTDKFAKVRPLIKLLNKKFQQYSPKEKFYSFDKSMCEYYGRHSRRRRGAGGGRSPPFGSKRRKLSKIRANGLFIWANSLDIWAHHCQNIVSDSVKTFFFWRTPSFGQKNRSNFRKDLFFFWRTLSFGQKNRSNFRALIWTEKPLSFKFQERPSFFFFENTSIWA